MRALAADLGHEIDAGDAARARRPGQAREPNNWRTIGNNKGTVCEVSLEGGIATSAGEKVEVRSGDSGAVAASAGQEAEFGGLGERAVEDSDWAELVVSGLAAEGDTRGPPYAGGATADFGGH